MDTAAKFEGNNCNLAALLIKNGADVNAKNNDGVTPLMYATFRNNYEVIKLLIKKGADVNARDYSESTALKYSTNEEMKKFLKKYGAK